MDWFKHSTSSHDDPDISDAIDEFGQAGYSAFFIVLEIYGDEFNHLDADGWLTVSSRFLARKLRLSSTKVQQILNFYSERQRLFVKYSKNTISIMCPKYIEIASNWVKRKTSRPTEGLQRDSVAPTAIEEEVEEERKKEEIPKEPAEGFTLPSKEEIEEGSTAKVEADLNAVCKQLYDSKIFPKAHAFKNMALKHKTNTRAVLHTLQRCYLTTPEDPWAYCAKILKLEHLNYNERDYRKTAG